MATFILIHGAWQGSWVWEKITPLLATQGHNVITPDLPGNGADASIALRDVTLDRYVQHILKIIDTQKEKVILVGHSFAGAIISMVAEAAAEKIEKLVYLCAYFPRNGESMLDMINYDPNPNFAMEFSEDHISSKLVPSTIQALLLNECSPETVQAAQTRITSQAMGVFRTPLTLSDAKYGSVKKVYIECEKDKAISLKTQRAMLKAQPGLEVFTLATDHSPFFSTPDALGKILNQVAEPYCKR